MSDTPIPDGTVILTTEDISNATCSWCDCPDDKFSLHGIPGYTCDGCDQRTTRRIVSHMTGTTQYSGYPLCDRHYDPARRTLRTTARHAGTPVIERP